MKNICKNKYIYFWIPEIWLFPWFVYALPMFIDLLMTYVQSYKKIMITVLAR